MSKAAVEAFSCAGGNLAAAVTLQARSGGPALACQVLVYPNTLYGADTASMRENDELGRRLAK